MTSFTGLFLNSFSEAIRRNSQLARLAFCRCVNVPFIELNTLTAMSNNMGYSTYTIYFSHTNIVYCHFY